ncbi:MAG: GNAT family N-acetyltransferase [bacterium]|nr:GNAT family N-acetyltransferase [bacterium]
MLTSRGPAYRIRTGQLLARCWSPADAPRLRESLDTSDQHLRPWVPFMKDEPRSLDGTLGEVRAYRSKFDADEVHRYALFTPDEAELVGEGMLFPRAGRRGLEIGYWIDVRHVRRGYATEITAALVRVAFGVHRVERVEVHCAAENAGSAAVPARLGFTHEATLRRRAEGTDGRVYDLMLWTLFAEQVAGSPAARAQIEAVDALGEPLALGSS